MNSLTLQNAELCTSIFNKKTKDLFISSLSHIGLKGVVYSFKKSLSFLKVITKKERGD